MGKLTRTLAGLAVAATPVLGAAAHPGGVLADNGVLHGSATGGPAAVRTLADNGVIHAQLAGRSESAPAPADNGVISSHN